MRGIFEALKGKLVTVRMVNDVRIVGTVDPKGVLADFVVIVENSGLRKYVSYRHIAIVAEGLDRLIK